MKRSRLTFVAVVLIVSGAGVAIVSALGDRLGGEQGFGWKQTTGVAVGGAVVLGGLLLLARSRAVRADETR